MRWVLEGALDLRCEFSSMHFCFLLDVARFPRDLQKTEQHSDVVNYLNKASGPQKYVGLIGCGASLINIQQYEKEKSGVSWMSMSTHIQPLARQQRPSGHHVRNSLRFRPPAVWVRMKPSV
jgi:hypothetical protein